jgi:hypothetical protein
MTWSAADGAAERWVWRSPGGAGDRHLFTAQPPGDPYRGARRSARKRAQLTGRVHGSGYHAREPAGGLSYSASGRVSSEAEVGQADAPDQPAFAQRASVAIYSLERERRSPAAAGRHLLGHGRDENAV